VTSVEGTAGFVEEAWEAARGVVLDAPEYDFSIRWAKDFDALFRNEGLTEAPTSDLVDTALKTGRVLLQSPGGTGKTSILSRLQRESPRTGMVMLRIDVRRWRPDLLEVWDEIGTNGPERMRFLLEELTSPPGVSEDDIDHLGDDVPSLLLIDGLNEVPKETGNEVVAVASAFARRHPRSGVIVADRLVRRPLDDSHWTLATIAPLDGRAGLDGIAFFQNLTDPTSHATTKVEAMKTFLTVHCSLDAADVATLGRAVLALYREAGTRTFFADDLRSKIGNDLFSRVLESGLVQQTDADHACFAHHLFQDYLAAQAFSERRDEWTYDGLDALTFRASSFDALAFALEEIDDRFSSELLLRRIFDWNFYGSAYALAIARGEDAASVGPDMELALLAMLSERRWDPFRSTQEQVVDALTLYPSAQAEALLAAASLSQIFEWVRQEISEDSALRDWRDLFTREPGAEPPSTALEILAQEDSLMGWTMANVLRRSELTDDVRDELISLVKNPGTDVVRWRATHVLGAHPSRLGADALLSAAGDVNWVAYGAVRSLFEMASRSSGLRADLVGQVEALVDLPEMDQRWLSRQIGRDVRLVSPPADWASVVGPLLERLWASAMTTDEQDLWRSVAFELRTGL